MVNIVVSQNMNVTGDKGKIIAYEGQGYSEVINIVHPSFPGAEYYIEYKYDNTILRNKLDSNGHVSIKVGRAGYVNCQFIAVNISDGDIVFASKTWSLIIKEALKIEESHYPCSSMGHHYKHRPPVPIATPNGYCNPNDFNAYEAYAKLSNELSNEEDIRFNEIQNLRQEIADIKAYLGIDNAVRSKLDANECITPGTYKASAMSDNFPDPNKEKEYDLVVSYYGDENILQNAYEVGSDNVYYRSTIDITSGVPATWTDWTLLNLSGSDTPDDDNNNDDSNNNDTNNGCNCPMDGSMEVVTF